MDPAKMKVVDLRSELGALGLDTKGNKPALVERLKKALEAKTGRVIADTTILDTSTEDNDELGTPRRPIPAARTTRRSSSSRLAATPAKTLREDPPEVIEEDSKESHEEEKEKSDEKQDDIYSIGDEESQSPNPQRENEEDDAPMEQQREQHHGAGFVDNQNTEDDSENNRDASMEEVNKTVEEKIGEDDKEAEDKKPEPPRELTEEEEWEELNKRLQVKEQERLEREKKQKEDDARKLEELSNDPIKLQRLKRKQEKKARWNNYYRAIEVTNKVLTPPTPNTRGKKNKSEPVVEIKIPEPELDEDKVTLSWYDSDLNQYLELPELTSVVPLSDGAFAHAWAGARASHGAAAGRVCYEVRVGAVVTTTESADKEAIINGLRVGWSTDDSSLHLGEGEMSFGYESSGRAVNNGEFKEYGKTFTEKDVIGVYLDLESSPCTVSYTLNGLELGVAYELDRAALADRALYPHVLTKNTCYRVNLGYDRYNMLSKTKIVRKRVEVPIEEVLEEKRKKAEEFRKQRQEQARLNRERREKEKKEREERQKKKNEERDKQEKERKEKEKERRRERGEPEEEDEPEKEKEADPEQSADDQILDADAADDEQKDEPMENGDKPEEQGKDSTPQPAVEVKTEPMETDEQQPAKDIASDDKDAADVKSEPKGDAQEITEEEFNKGPVLDKRIKFVIRYLVEEELDGAEACLLPGYVVLALATLTPGPRRPPTTRDCEVILMVGMPGAGKTYWARQHAAANPDKRYNILSTGALFDRMKVDCKPFRATYEGRWDAMVSKCAKCVLKMLEIAKGRRRNFILDQTNVYPSAQRRKLKEFEGYRRVAVVIVTDQDTYLERTKRREEADGKEVPDGAIVDMKANFTLPEPGAWLDEVLYPELDEQAARLVVEQLHKEAALAGAARERDKRARSGDRDGPPAKRARSPERREHRRPRDREDRWGGGGGGSRWGPAGGGGGGGSGGGGGGGSGGGGGGGRGGRWGGGRDRSMGSGPGGRFDRGWNGPPQNRNDFGRDRDNFRGGRGPGGPGGPRQDRGMGGPGGRGPMDGNRFQRDNRPQNRGPPGDKRPGMPPNKNPIGQGAGGVAGSWQRGSQQQPGGRGPPQRPNQAPGQRQDGSNQNQLQNKGNQNVGQGPNQNQGQNAQNQQGWNQWAGGWGGWGNWGNQNQGWGNWNNWGWGNPQGGSTGTGQQTGNQQANTKGQPNAQQWPANYTAQQWYQWQQWQQQQQGWPGYQQGSQGNATSNNEQAQAWAQYYQNYGGGNAANANTTSTAVEKK